MVVTRLERIDRDEGRKDRRVYGHESGIGGASDGRRVPSGRCSDGCRDDFEAHSPTSGGRSPDPARRRCACLVRRPVRRRRGGAAHPDGRRQQGTPRRQLRSGSGGGCGHEPRRSGHFHPQFSFGDRHRIRVLLPEQGRARVVGLLHGYSRRGLQDRHDQLRVQLAPAVRDDGLHECHPRRRDRGRRERHRRGRRHRRRRAGETGDQPLAGREDRQVPAHGDDGRREAESPGRRAADLFRARHPDNGRRRCSGWGGRPDLHLPGAPAGAGGRPGRRVPEPPGGPAGA